MQEFLSVMGMILKTVPVGDYDRRVVILTKEMGKISAFAKSARKPNSHLVAATSPFSFGTFRLYAGRSSYNIIEADISNYFESLRDDFASAYYGMYFLEVIDYYTRENNDESDFLKLIYQSLKALLNANLDNRLVRSVFEIKAMVTEGEFPGLPSDRKYSESAEYTVRFIESQRIEKLYTFKVSEEVLLEITSACRLLQERYIDRKFKSLELLP